MMETTPLLLHKKIVIIGGTTGMGLAAAKAFISAGAQVVAVGKDAETTAQAQKILGKQARCLTDDATLETTATKAIDCCLDIFKGFTGLYHVAGGSGRRFGDGQLHAMTLEGWQKTIDLNVTSVMLSNRAAIRAFLAAGNGGAILNMGSVLAFSPSAPLFATHAYAAAKAAIIGLSKAAAAHYATDNIRVNVVCPAVTDTPMAQRAVNDAHIASFIRTKQPLDGGRFGYPNDLDGAAMYFLSDYSRFTTGQVLSIDGGWSHTDGQREEE